jgi:hypothetical protein
VRFENIRGEICCGSVRPSRFHEDLHRTILAKQAYYAMRSTSAVDQNKTGGPGGFKDRFWREQTSVGKTTLPAASRP